MKKSLVLVLLTVISQMSFPQGINYSLGVRTNISNNELENNFHNPQDEVKMRVYWWWLNSYVTKQSITRDLEEMKAKGICGAIILDAGSSNYTVAKKTQAGPVFMSEAWMENYSHAIKEGERLGVELSINLQSGWNPGAPCVTPEYAAKRVTFSECEISGPGKITKELPLPANQLLYEDILIQAYPLSSDDTIPQLENWKKKAMYASMGSAGTYPLHQLWQDSPQKSGQPVIKKSEIIDLTGHVKNGKLEWDVPPGKWKVIRYGMTCTGARVSTASDGWTGLSYDHLSKRSFQLFADSIINPLINRAFASGNSLKYLHTDSWEMGATNWTPSFISDFKELRGYDMKVYMPVLAGKIVESKEISNRFLYDFRRTIGDLVVKNHYQLLKDLAKKNKLGIHPESGGPHSAPVDGIQVLGISDIPTGEFWARANTHRVADDHRLAVRQSANAAHTYGRRFVMAEGPTSIGPQWERSPRDLKSVLDRVFCSGTNRILWHTFTSSPQEMGRPGNEYFAGTHLNPNATWWDYSNDFINYINRCSQMLSEGLYQADILYYYGDNVPNFVFLKEDWKDLPFGFGYDKCSKNILMEKASMRDGRLYLPDGMNYKVLMLPEIPQISTELLIKLEQFVKEGLILIGNKPAIATGLSSYPDSDDSVKEITERMWKNTTIQGNNYGKGKVITGTNIGEILKQLNIQPDFSFTSGNSQARMDFIHRYTENADFYFITNSYARKEINDFVYRYLTDLPDRYESVNCKFRITGKVPEIWDPKSGTVRKVVHYKEENGYISFPLTMDPEAALFVVFRDAATSGSRLSLQMNGTELNVTASASPVVDMPVLYQQGNKTIGEFTQAGNYTLISETGKKSAFKVKNSQKIIQVQNAWKLDFEEKWGPSKKIEVKELKSWTDFEEESIRYYSGKATYSTTINLSKTDLNGYTVYIDLGNLSELAKIRVNGTDLGVLWYPPYLANITNVLKPGDNKLEVEVVNLWPNRLIGDSKLPQDKRNTQTNIIKYEDKDSEKLLRQSGLIGPVKLICKPTVTQDL